MKNWCSDPERENNQFEIMQITPPNQCNFSSASGSAELKDLHEGNKNPRLPSNENEPWRLTWQYFT